MIKSNMGKPGQQEKALGRFIASLTQDDIYNLRRNIYQRLDILLPGYGMRSRFASFFCLVFGLGKWSENHSCRCDLQVLPDSASWARSLQAVNHATVFHCWQNHRDDNGDVPATSHDGGGRSVCLLLEAFQTFGLMILSRLFLCPLSTHTHSTNTSNSRTFQPWASDMLAMPSPQSCLLHLYLPRWKLCERELRMISLRVRFGGHWHSDQVEEDFP